MNLQVGEVGSKKRIMIDAFTGLEQDDEGQVYYILGVGDSKSNKSFHSSYVLAHLLFVVMYLVVKSMSLKQFRD